MKFLLALLLVMGALGGVALANDDKVTICHHTGSQTNPTVTITVSENAWEAHQKHGDTRGPCSVPSATATRTPTPTHTAGPTASPNATGSPRATPTPGTTGGTATPSATPKGPTTSPAPAPVKQLPSTSTD